MLGKLYYKSGNEIYLLARVLLGVLFFIFGLPKLTGWLWDYGTMPVGSLFWFAGLAEVLGGTAIALGVLTRLGGDPGSH
ncbi:MAG: DoxX family protein [SAR202 cluster bacterium]|nr:DoxX family protein [SAR202 cluster bacterium]